MTESDMPSDGAEAFGGFRPGQSVSHYDIVDRIGAGGIGEVYLAYDSDLNRQVALKVLSPALCQDESCRHRFRREAQAVASLNHPNIVQIYEVAEHDGQLYFAMEYVEGPPLEEHCRRDEDRVRRVSEVGVQVCDALEAAHAAGLTHRDIKPANLLVGEDGRIRLADFGLAAIEGGERLSGSAITSGTVGYMSPEQIRSETVGSKSDIFSLGVVLYELLAGRRPFTGDYEAAVQFAIVNDPTPSLAESCEGVREELDQLIATMLSKEPHDRPESVAEVKRRLAEVGGIALSPVGSAHRMRRIVYWTIPLLIVAVVAVYVQWFRASAPARPLRLAVLPLQSLSPPEYDYLATGITEAVTTRLASLNEVRVISTRRAALLQDTRLDTRAIGDELGVQYILEGTVQIDGEGEPGYASINIRLLRISDDIYMWSQEYHPTALQLLAVQAKIATEIAEALDIIVTESQAIRLARPPTESPEAWDLYLRGNAYFSRTWSADDISIAIRMYRRAVALDSNFALAWAMLSRGHASMYFEYYDRSDELCQQALDAAEQALELQPDLAEGHEALGYCYYHCYMRFDAAMDEFKAGLMFQPSNAGLYNAIAAVQRRQAQLVESIENFGRALSLDPQSQQKTFDIALTYGMMRRHDSARAYVDKTLALAPEWTLVHLYRAWLPIIEDGDTAAAARSLAETDPPVDMYHSPFYWWLARLIGDDYAGLLDVSHPGTDTAAYYIHRARVFRLMESSAAMMAAADTARSLLDERLRDHPEDPRYMSQMSLAHAYLGNAGQAIEMGSRAVQFLPASREAFDAPFLIVNLAEVLVMCGRYDDAVGQLEILLSIPGFVSAPYLELDPLWEPLQDHERFQILLAGGDRLSGGDH